MTMQTPVKAGPGRPLVSCTVCRKRKLKCDRQHPCRNCLRSRSKNPERDCVYEDAAALPARDRARPPRRRSSVSQQRPTPSATPDVVSQASGPVSPADAEAPVLVSRPDPAAATSCSHTTFSVVSRSCASTSAPHSVRGPKSLASEVDSACQTIESSFFGHTMTAGRGVTHKSRFFGQSHWLSIIVLFRDLAATITTDLCVENSKALLALHRCKALAREIKAQRSPTWPAPLTAALPAKNLADELVDSYLDTTETVYRVLHIPSFRRDYDSFWLLGADTLPDRAFLIQLKLVLAIGATSYDDTFSLHSSAMAWVYEAQTYLSEPGSKSQLSIQFLQISILLLIAQEAMGIEGHALWISAGALVRTAMHMGVHRDPTDQFAASRPRLAHEMCLRLWSTVLELALQSSFVAGKPPLVSIDDFDAPCPGNFDDDQLMPEVKDPLPKPNEDFTQTTISIALRKMFPLRLAAAKMLNDANTQETYEEAQKLDQGLRDIYKDVCRTLACARLVSPASAPRFDTSALDVIVHRYISSVHVPFLDRGQYDTAYAFSRQASVDAALRIWRATSRTWHRAPPSVGLGSGNGFTSLPVADKFGRFARCGSAAGFFRSAAFHANLTVAFELKTQLREQESLGPAMLRPDLLSVLEDAKNFTLQCINAGETNVKGYIFICLITTQIYSLQQGMTSDQVRPAIVKAVEDALDVALHRLEKMQRTGPGRKPADSGLDSTYATALTTPSGVIPGYDSHVPDHMLQSTNEAMDLMNWMITDEGTLGALDGPFWMGGMGAR
ncbi:Transcription factor [Cordyceps fumosorosea ARSEF 2679]|uniref:Transcription factor n=1 Tax=Cordyceps fumosorosea (strain ARSEF 2679) TaxID=1081104 RepID=A0A162K5A3_CORFA|nr:Transcription factor [Cordyceps fumosorosea ARSEF 2679]OAA53528.1 Transcription factor [Cordyceps fumosorosea ARSEF 2679]